MYPVMLPGPVHDDNGFSSFRNPDQLFPERQGTAPDGIGRLYVRLLEFVSDAWDEFRRSAKLREGGAKPVDADPTTDPAFQRR